MTFNIPNSNGSTFRSNVNSALNQIETDISTSVSTAISGLGTVNNKITDYTLQASDNNKVITVDDTSSSVIIVPDTLVQGFSCMVIQLGAGQITISGSGSMVIHEPDGKIKTAKQYAGVSIYISSSNNCILGGYTA